MQRQTTSYAGRSLSVLFASFAALAHALLPLTAQENRAFTFDQDAQSLSTALDAFSEATGVRVLAPSSALKGKTAPALNGDLSAGVALETLLAGSGLESEFVSDESVAIRRPASIRKESYIQLDSITVKGELQERSLLETNTSVNIQTGADIARSNDKRISDVFSRAANVNINGSGLQAFSFSIRGINSSGVGGSGNGALASLTVDGAAFTTQQLARGYNSLFDIEQVEILRGPQSTSQARNSLAGAVVVQTKDPEFVQDTQAVALIGDYGNYEFGVANTGPLNKEFAYRVAFQRTNSDGFIENPVLGTDSYNYSDTDTLRTKLLYQPESSPLEIVLGYTHVQADARNDVSSWFPETQQYINSNPYGEGGMDTEQDVATLSVSYDLSDRWTLQSQLAYNEFVSADLNSTYATSVPDRDQAWFATADQKEWNETLRFNYGGEKLRGTLGVFYSEDTNIVLREGVALQNAFGSGLDADVEIDSPADTDTQAFFGEFDFDATDRVTITLGGRYEKVDIATVSSTVANLILPPPAPYTVIQPGIIDASVNASTDFDVFLPKFGITYALDKEQRLGFTYSEGYRQGGVTADPTTLQIGQYEPEFVKNYEVSYKGA
ncbi:MAG: TonB-dependent receptor, partial [Verrucomicrobiota bacterium]